MQIAGHDDQKNDLLNSLNNFLTGMSTENPIQKKMIFDISRGLFCPAATETSFRFGFCCFNATSWAGHQSNASFFERLCGVTVRELLAFSTLAS